MSAAHLSFRLTWSTVAFLRRAVVHDSSLDQMLSDATGLPVVIADDPLSAVANGTGMVLHELAFLLKDLTAALKTNRATWRDSASIA